MQHFAGAALPYQPRQIPLRKPMAAMLDLMHDENAATMVEYAIMAALIAAVCLALVLSVGAKTRNEYSAFNALY
ncbi:MAG: Flp family type IVb pilin [Candidatus Baltobacteraceae bacterium]